MSNSKIAIRWSIIDNNGNKIVLKENTMTEHIINDHSSKDSEVRAEVESQIPYVLKRPALIVKDERLNSRIDYIGIVLLDKDEETYSLKNVIVVVDTAFSPWEVVTWFASRSTTVKKRGVIYDYKKNIDEGYLQKV